MPKLDDIAAHLAAVPMFSQLSAKERRHVAKALGVHDVAEGVMLVRQGEAGDTFYVLLEGDAKVVRNGRKIASARHRRLVRRAGVVGPGSTQRGRRDRRARRSSGCSMRRASGGSWPSCRR